MREIFCRRFGEQCFTAREREFLRVKEGLGFLLFISSFIFCLKFWYLKKKEKKSIIRIRK